MVRIVCIQITIALALTKIGFAEPLCFDSQCLQDPRQSEVSGAGHGTRKQVAPDIQLATVLVRAFHRNGSRSLQTGVITATHGNTGLVITAAHLFRDAVARVEVHPPDSHARPYAAKVLTMGNPNQVDVAVLQFTADSPLVAIPLTDQDPLVGTPVIQVGYPGGRHTQVVRHGKIVRHEGIRRYQVMSFEVVPGDSGSVVFSGNQIAGLVWGSRSGDGAFAERPERIRRVLETACHSGGCQWALRKPHPNKPSQADPWATTIQELQAELQRLQKQVRVLKLTPVPAEPAGIDDRDAKVTLQQVALYVREHLQRQPIHVQIVDPGGVVKQKTSVRLGGTLRLQLVPLRRKSADR